MPHAAWNASTQQLLRTAAPEGELPMLSQMLIILHITLPVRHWDAQGSSSQPLERHRATVIRVNSFGLTSFP